MLGGIRTLVVVAGLGLWAAAIADEPSGVAPNESNDAATAADYIDAVSDRFTAALEKQKLPYVTAVELAALRAELHQYLKRRVKTPLVGPRRTDLLEAIDKFVEIKFSGPASYAGFRTNFDSLSWQLWTATERPELTTDELAERDRQREWMVAYIRDLPITDIERDSPEWQHEARLRALKEGVFNSPLSPFFHDPMSAEEFDAFKRNLKASGLNSLANSTRGIFFCVVNCRSRSLLERWPAAQRAQIGAFHGANTTTDFYYFNFIDLNRSLHAWVVGPSKNGERAYFDLAARAPVEQPPPLDAAATEHWLSETKKGDLWYDEATRRLLPVRGTKMATLKETELYAVDRVPMSELRRLLREAPVESLIVPEFSNPAEAKQALETLPTIVLENAEGTIAVAHIDRARNANSFILQFSYRPLAPYPPFHPADEGYDDPNPSAPAPVEVADEAPTAIDPAADFIDVVSDRFAAALEKQNLPYMTTEALAALHAELHRYLKRRVKTPLVGPSRTEILAAMNKFVQQKFAGKDSYGGFRVHFDVLMWQLWTVLDRPELNPAELAERERQRQWMRDYIRNMPETELEKKAGKQFAHDAELKRLENEVFGNALSPVFYDPMSAGEFAEFTKRVDLFKTGAPGSPNNLAGTPSGLFSTAVHVRAPSLLRRWPPGFRISSLSARDTQDFFFREPPTTRMFPIGPTKDGSREYLGLATSKVTQPPPLDAAATERWLSENKHGDLWFDAATRRLLPVHGAKIALLEETEWYALDRIPIAQLRKRVREAPVESMTIPEFSSPNSPEARRALRKLPTLVLESAAGRIALVRAPESGGGTTFWLSLNDRPQPRNLPFHPADEGYEEPGSTIFSPIETADALSDRFARALKEQNLPFVGPDELAVLRAEIHDYLETRVTMPLDKPTREVILKAIDKFVLRNFSEPDCYLRFRNQFDALKWQLWTATEPKNQLSPEARQVKWQQRNWMRAYVQKLLRDGVNGQARQPRDESPLKQLESEVFGNVLNPFFDEPMSEEEFAAFKKRVESDSDLDSAPARIFRAAVAVGAATLKKQWPPGFPAQGVHMHGTQDFDFRGTRDDMRWMSGPAPDGRRLFFDAASNNFIEPPAGLDEKGTEAWLLETKKGDLWFDAKTRRLIAVRGAKLTTLPETDWYAIDRISMATLQKRLAEAPRESYSLAELPGDKPDRLAVEKIVRALPTLVLETAEGKIVLLRVERYDGESALLLGRARPLAPYLPFHAGDNDAATTRSDPPSNPTDAAPKEKGAENPAAADP